MSDARKRCAVDGCERRYFAKGYCNTHYCRLRRNGTLDLKARTKRDKKPPSPAAPKRQCAAHGCEQTERRRGGYCSKHQARIDRHGDPEMVIVGRDKRMPRGASHHAWREMPTYDAAHQRVRNRRGRATLHPCVDCGIPAAHWSYNHEDPNELVGEKEGRRMRFSSDPRFYDPRCVSCHKRFDLSIQKSAALG